MGNIADQVPAVLAFPHGATGTSQLRAKAVVFSDPRSYAAHNYLERVAPSNVSVLIQGETGTGKELLARHLHQQSAVD